MAKVSAAQAANRNRFKKKTEEAKKLAKKTGISYQKAMKKVFQ